MNRLLEVYSRGLYDSLSNESVFAVVEHFQNISNDSSVHGLIGLFKNKTVQKEEKHALACKGVQLKGKNKTKEHKVLKRLLKRKSKS